MLRFLAFMLFFFCISVYVLFDSGALKFEARTMASNDLTMREGAAPVFRGERLQSYFNKLVSKIGK